MGEDVTDEEILETANDVLKGTTRSHVAAAAVLARWVKDRLAKPAPAIVAQGYTPPVIGKCTCQKCVFDEAVKNIREPDWCLEPDELKF